MYKKVTIWSTKGGVGKTSICAELHFRLGFPVVTNEKLSMLPSIVDNKLLKILDDKEKIQNYNNNIIFDFGGYVDNRIIDALKQSNYVIVPVTANAIDLQGCIDTIASIKDYNSNIIIAINKVKNKKDIEFTKNVLSKLGIFKYFTINDSKAMANIFKQKSSVTTMMKNKLLNYIYRNINSQIAVLAEHIAYV